MELGRAGESPPEVAPENHPKYPVEKLPSWVISALACVVVAWALNVGVLITCKFIAVEGDYMYTRLAYDPDAPEIIEMSWDEGIFRSCPSNLLGYSGYDGPYGFHSIYGTDPQAHWTAFRIAAAVCGVLAGALPFVVLYIFDVNRIPYDSRVGSLVLALVCFALGSFSALTTLVVGNCQEGDCLDTPQCSGDPDANFCFVSCTPLTTGIALATTAAMFYLIAGSLYTVVWVKRRTS